MKQKGLKTSFDEVMVGKTKQRRDKKAILSDQCKEIEENNDGKD